MAWMMAAFLLPGFACASSITQLESSSTYTLNPDSTFVEENFARVRVDEQPGIRMAGQIPVRFSTSLHTIEILEAFTTTKDGQRLDVAPDKILEQQLPQSTGAPADYLELRAMSTQIAQDLRSLITYEQAAGERSRTLERADHLEAMH